MILWGWRDRIQERQNEIEKSDGWGGVVRVGKLMKEQGCSSKIRGFCRILLPDSRNLGFEDSNLFKRFESSNPRIRILFRIIFESFRWSYTSCLGNTILNHVETECSDLHWISQKTKSSYLKKIAQKTKSSMIDKNLIISIPSCFSWLFIILDFLLFDDTNRLEYSTLIWELIISYYL